MTFDERVQALEFLRLTDRQTRFLTTVALHSGYCLRRQYLAFAGVRYGKNVRDFLDGLVMRGIALRFTYRADRGHVYHLHARAIYRALQQDDNRNRRVASPALIARKLMLLDLVLSEPDVEWFATEHDKVELFTARGGIDADDLPHRTFDGDGDDDAATTRYFIDKLPIYVPRSAAVPHFVYLASDTSTQGFEQFLRDHRRLFARLPAWAVVCAKPAHLVGLSAHETTFNDFVQGKAVGNADGLRRLFATRRLVEDGQLGKLTADDLHGFRQARKLFATPRTERLYVAWLADGEAAFTDVGAPPLGSGQLLSRTLPHTYEQFGSMAGVA
jgi:hypothetical protein